jgi:chaperonin GroEL (HSP60 family)
VAGHGKLVSLLCCHLAEKGLSDLAAHYLMKANVTAIRRLRKTDNNRIARACGATIVSRPGEPPCCEVRALAAGRQRCWLAIAWTLVRLGNEDYELLLACL